MLEALSCDFVPTYSRGCLLSEASQKDIASRSEAHFSAPDEYSLKLRLWVTSPDKILYLTDSKKYKNLENNEDVYRVVYAIEPSGKPVYSRGKVRVFTDMFIPVAQATEIKSKPTLTKLDDWMRAIRENVEKVEEIRLEDGSAPRSVAFMGRMGGACSVTTFSGGGTEVPRFVSQTIECEPLNFTVKGRKKMTQEKLKDKKVKDAMSLFREAGLLGW